jgi:UDP-N-acetylglucosamine 1-carboxyvinyltransferase
MSKLIVEGGYELCGSIKIDGAKNTTLPLIAASVLTEENVELINVPNITDVQNMLHLVLELGSSITLNGDIIIEYSQECNSVIIQNKNITPEIKNEEIAEKIRTSFLLLGPLLARFQKAILCLPGGCAIGKRPVDIHIDNLIKMGAKIKIEGNMVHAEGKLHGEELTLKFQSVGATQNLLMAATIAEGRTIINNASYEPETQELCLMLIQMGAKIDGIGTSRLVIDGVKSLKGTRFYIKPDRITAASYAALAVATNSKISLENSPIDLFPQSYLDIFQKSGIKFVKHKNSLHIEAIEREDNVVIKTEPYPGFSTDLQPIFATLLAISNNNKTYHSQIIETLFEKL